MNTKDLYMVGVGFKPFYKIPVGVSAQVFTWIGYSGGSHHYSSNIVVKESDIMGSMGGTLDSQPSLYHTSKSIGIVLNPNDLVKQVSEDSNSNTM